MAFGTKDGNPLSCCSPTVINSQMTGDGSVDPSNPYTGSDNKWTIIPGVPTFPANDYDYCIDSKTGEIYVYRDGQWVDTGKNINVYVDGTTPTPTPTDDTFMDAPTARLDATQTAIINSEISAIETAINAAVAANNFDTTVSGTTMTTPITTGVPYFRVWKDMDPCCPIGYNQRQINYQMNQVMEYFQNLKYVIKRYQPTTDNNFVWRIYW